ncbi:MAG TPA: hypothetical protein VIM65_13755 [Cyclobacteriaceae bacterium]
MQNYFEKDFIAIGYDKTNHLIVLKWKIAPTSAEFREGLHSLLAAIEQFKTGKVIVDTTHLGTIHPDDQQWSVTEWTQKAMQAGYSKLAIIIPDDIFTQMSVEDAMNSTNNILPFAYFSNMTPAMEWITKA